MSGEKISSVEYSTKYIRSFKKLPPPIQAKAREKEMLFIIDPFTARLETHKLHGKLQDYWAYSVDYKYRVIFRFLNGTSALFFDIGLHPIYRDSE